MFLRWYRKRIAKAVEDKMCWMCCCPNTMGIVLSIIAPKDYKREGVPHCNTDCGYTDCKSYKYETRGQSNDSCKN